MRLLKIALAIIAITTTITVSAQEVTGKQVVTKAQRAKALNYADDLLSCAVAIRSSFPDHRAVPSADGKGTVTILDIYLDIYSAGEDIILKLAPKVTKEDVADIVAVKNTLWFKVSPEDKQKTVSFCVEKVLGGKSEDKKED
jgi:hypothetical protein